MHKQILTELKIIRQHKYIKKEIVEFPFGSFGWAGELESLDEGILERFELFGKCLLVPLIKKFFRRLEVNCNPPGSPFGHLEAYVADPNA